MPDKPVHPNLRKSTMAASHKDYEEEGSLKLPDHIGKCKEQKKSNHLIEVEKTLLEENVPIMTMKVGCLTLFQDAKIRANKKVSNLVSRGFQRFYCKLK